MRNKRRHGELPIPIHKAVEWARDMAFDLWQLVHPVKEMKVRGTRRWKKPDEGWLKCNVDGAFSGSGYTGATGAAIRDSAGLFIAGRAQWIRRSTDALQTEAMACKDGL